MRHTTTNINLKSEFSDNINIKDKRKNVPKLIINDYSEQALSFNVLANKNITETLIIKKYRIWDGSIEATFSRKYETDMVASPNHLIFISALINLQKMVYIYMHHFLNIKYEPDGNETLKVWPTDLNISIPKLYTKEDDIIHRLDVKSIRNIGKNRYFINADTFIEDSLTISGKALIIRL
tara:strand:- start:109 stop:648 length:540 start_codon:yes stop_codon:yes gene_type:complete